MDNFRQEDKTNIISTSSFIMVMQTNSNKMMILEIFKLPIRQTKINQAAINKIREINMMFSVIYKVHQVLPLRKALKSPTRNLVKSIKFYFYDLMSGLY